MELRYIVGSTAIKHHIPDFREPADLDVWSNVQLPLLAADVSVMPDNIMSLVEGIDKYASLDSLYTIKLSHLGWDIFFEKHKKDALLLKHYGAKLIPDLFDALVEHWKKTHGNKDFLSLYKTKTQFFNVHVVYIYDHDYLHELAAYPNEPMYKMCLKEGEQVAIDYVKFSDMPYDDKIKMFREEIVVIACERWLINPSTRGKVSWIQAYQYALRKTITQLTKNWATEFLVKNLEMVVKVRYDEFKHIIETLEELKMSKLNTTNIEAYLAKFGQDLSDHNIVKLASGDIGFETNSIQYPERGSRDYKDPSYQLECDAYHAAVAVLEEEANTEFQYKHIKQAGGGEGGSEYCLGIFSILGQAYRVEWRYYSYDGYEREGALETLVEVSPVEKTVVVWE